MSLHYFAENTVGLFDNLNFKNKDTAGWEILIMLAGAFILGWLSYWLYHRFIHLDDEMGGGAPAARRSSRPDDLTMIEGVGPKINELLQDDGINTFQDLADSDVDDIKDILEEAGSRYRMHDPSSWAEQAQLAADGDFDELEKLKDELTGGK